MTASIFFVEGAGVKARALIDVSHPYLPVRVLARSEAAKDASFLEGLYDNAHSLRTMLVQQGMLAERAGRYEFLFDFLFASISVGLRIAWLLVGRRFMRKS